MIEPLGWLLAVLESISIAQHASPKIRSLAERLRSGLIRRRTTAAFFIQRDPYVVGPADEVVARQCFKLGDTFLGEATGLTEKTFLTRRKHCPTALQAVHHISPETQTATLQGYFILLPLTKGGLTAIEKGHVEAGRHLRDSDICRSFQHYAALYVSVVFARGPVAQVATVRALTAAIFIQKKLHPSLKQVFVRPTTTLGRRAFFRATGVEASTDGRIECINLSKTGGRDLFEGTLSASGKGRKARARSTATATAEPVA